MKYPVSVNGSVRWLGCLLICSSTFLCCSLSRYANKAYSKAENEKPFDVIVVPGVPFQGAQTTPVMKMRLFWAKHLYDSGFTKNIIFSGSSVYSPFVEGKVMKIMADSLGIPPEHTFSETKAEHSTENAYYSWLMAKEMGFKKIALATDPFQGRLLKSFMKRHCPGMMAIPIKMGTLDINSKSLPKIDASSAAVKDFVPITENESFFKRFRYTLGKRVRDEKKAERKKKRKEQRALKKN